MSRHVAVVTGGSRGLGRACAVALAETGWTVAIGYRSSETDAKETAAALEAVGKPGLAVYLDITDESSVQEAFRRVSDEVGSVTGLVNNAGFSQDGLLVKYSMDTYDRVMGTNVRGAFLCTQSALRGMLRAKFGRIVNMSSAVALHGNAGQTVYAASKTALLGLDHVPRARGRREGHHRQRHLPRVGGHRHDIAPGRQGARALRRPDAGRADGDPR